MKTWTIKEMLAEKPCQPKYDKQRLIELWNGRDSLSMLDILDLDIPDNDKVWALCRPKAFEKQAQWIEGIAERVACRHALPHEVTKEWMQAWLNGEDRSAYAAARAASHATADAPRAAAYTAADAAECKQQIADARQIIENSDD